MITFTYFYFYFYVNIELQVALLLIRSSLELRAVSYTLYSPLVKFVEFFLLPTD